MVVTAASSNRMDVKGEEAVQVCRLGTSKGAVEEDGRRDKGEG